MGRVVADMSVSLDGFVAGPHDEVEHVFSCYGKPQSATAGSPRSARPGSQQMRSCRSGHMAARSMSSCQPRATPPAGTSMSGKPAASAVTTRCKLPA